MKLRILSLLVCLAAASPSSAQENNFKEVDAELNLLYKQIEARLADSPDIKKELVEAQRAWIAFRDAECRFGAAGVEGATAYPDIYAGCAEGLTRDRIEDFKTYLSCEEGDLSCPLPPQ